MRNQPTYLHDVYEFSGSPYEIGFQRGKILAKRIKEALEGLSFGNRYFKKDWPKSEDYNLDYLKKNHPNLFKRWEKAMEKAPDWLKEEARGQADGAGVSYEKLIIAGNWLPFIMPVKNKPEPEENGDLYEDCNGFIAYGKATSDGKPILAGNGEASHKGASGLRIVRMKNEVGNSYVAEAKFCEYRGTRGLNTVQSGMNEKGVCIFGNGVSIKPEEYGDLGFIQMMKRIVLQEANNLDEAIDIHKELPRSPGGGHIYIADPKRAVHIESTGKRMNIIEPESGFSAGASPFFWSDKMRPYCNVISDMTDPRFDYMVAKARGLFRMERYHELFQEKKPLTVEDIPSILGDHGGRGTGLIQEHIEGACPQGSDYTICAHGSRKTSGREAGSFHAQAFSHICQPAIRKFWVAFGSPCEAGYVSFKPPK